MPRATTCLFEGKVLTVKTAIVIRDKTRRKDRGNLSFKCTECGQKVRPHKAGGHASAHFEHLMRNPACHLSDPAR